MKSTKDLARKLGLLRKRSTTSQQDRDVRKAGKTDQIFPYLVVIDFESTCWKDKKNVGQEIIEFPAVLLNTSNGETEAEFHTYVLPEENPVLSDFCTELTGITQEQVEAGAPLSVCLSQFSRWLKKQAADKGLAYNSNHKDETKKLCTFVTWSDWDLAICLHYECRRKQLVKPPALTSWIDLRATYKNHYQRKPQGLNGALQDVGITFDGRQHSGLDDSRNTAKLAWRMMCDGCVMKITRTMQGIINLVYRVYQKELYHVLNLNTCNIKNVQKRPSASRIQTVIKPTQDKTEDTPRQAPMITAQAVSYTANKSFASAVIAPPLKATSHPHRELSSHVNGVQPITVLAKQCQPFDIEQSVILTDKQEIYPTSEDLCQPYGIEQPINLNDKQEIYPTSEDLYQPYGNEQPINLNDKQEIYPASEDLFQPCNNEQLDNLKQDNCTTSEDLCPPACNNEDLDDTDMSSDEFMSATQAIAMQDLWGIMDTNHSNTQVDSGNYPCPKPLVSVQTCIDSTSETRKPLKRSGSLQMDQWGFKTPVGPAPNARKSISPSQQTPTCKPRLSPQMLGTKITPPLCDCGRRAKKNNVVSPGPNQGRGFYSCPNRRSGKTSESALQDTSNRRKPGCGYFKWESVVLRDRVAMSMKPVNYKYTPVSSISTPVGYKCGTPGTVGKLGQSFISRSASNRLGITSQPPTAGGRRLGMSQHTALKASPMTFKLSMH